MSAQTSAFLVLSLRDIGFLSLISLCDVVGLALVFTGLYTRISVGVTIVEDSVVAAILH
ncbi:MAG: hypothetical protein Ct9H300mP19_06900 [Dehalococcoidia bacterium]|nr:MAG: hypothetical protein Ct9H300mP19_06900 [Dehalococcoidia bacterium]